jgi:hypothetical protein
MGPEMKKPLVSAVTWGFGAPRGNRTPNPLIIGLIHSALPVVARNSFIS